MALIRCDFFSDALGLSTSMTVILPQQTVGQIGLTGTARPRPPTLYLLHGLSDDDTAWTRRTSIERYAAPLGLAVVMPQVHHGFYADEAYGSQNWTFLSEELPAVVGQFFRLSGRREDTFVAGLSMGGYGALKWALRQPDRFAAAASLSGALDLATGDDLRWLLDQADGAALPRLYLACGTEDFLYEENLTFRDACRAKGVPVTVDFGPGGHEWGYWDTKIQDVLAWLGTPP